MRIRIARSGKASMERRLDQCFNFPAIHYSRVAGRRHRYCCCVDPWTARGVTTLFSSTSKPARREWMIGEPLFVAAPGGDREDQGVLLSVGSHLARAAAALFVLDAETLDVLARAEAEVSVPFGFHGTFIH